MASHGVPTTTAAAAWHTAGPRQQRAFSSLWIHGGPAAFRPHEAFTAQLLCGCPVCRPTGGDGHNAGWACEWEAMATAVMIRTLVGGVNHEDVLEFVRRA